MMPELKALFDSPRRLMPGKGARMQGYGDKRSISEVQASGANGVLTLSRSDQSGLTPSLGTDEEPAELRAGPGVRLHGYGGIHTLERLPVVVVEEKVFQIAGLSIEVERVQLYAAICAEYDNISDPKKYVTGWVSVEDFENASITTTVQYDGGVSFSETLENLGNFSCERTQESDQNEDPNFDYGPALGTESYNETGTRSLSSLRSSTIGNLFTEATPVSNVWNSFPPYERDEWQEISQDVFTPEANNYLRDQGATTDLLTGTASAKACRWRIINNGTCSIKVDWEKRRESNNSLQLSGSVEVARGATSQWSNWPSLTSDPDDVFLVKFVRLRLGPYISLS